jgi:hypothetical protein
VGFAPKVGFAQKEGFAQKVGFVQKGDSGRGTRSTGHMIKALH